MGKELFGGVVNLPATLYRNTDGLLPTVAVSVDETNPATVKGNINVSPVTVTRPANSDPYIARDVVSDGSVITFANAVNKAGNSGYIVKVRLITNQSTNTARFRLHLYTTAPSPIADNAPFTLLAANAALRIGYIDLPACQTEGFASDAANTLWTMGGLNNASIQTPQGALSFKTTASTSVFGILETLDAFTPTSGQTFFVELTFDVNG